MASTRVVVLSSLLASCIALPLAAQVKTLKRLPAPAAHATAPGKDSIVVHGGRGEEQVVNPDLARKRERLQPHARAEAVRFHIDGRGTGAKDAQKPAQVR